MNAKRYFLLFFCLFALLTPCKAMAELSISLNTTLATSPYKNYDNQWMVMPMISYEGEYAYIRGTSAGIKIVDIEMLEVSTFLAYDGTSFDSTESSNSQLRKLHNRQDSLLGGAEARLRTPYGMFLVSAAGDLLNHSNGFTGDVGYRYSLDLDVVEFVPGAGIYWNSANYNNYYYGVKSDESRKSGLETYSPGGGVSPYVNLMVDFTINDNWDVYCQGEVVFLGEQIKDSPMVDSTSTKSISTGIVYTF